MKHPSDAVILALSQLEERVREPEDDPAANESLAELRTHLAAPCAVCLEKVDEFRVLLRALVGETIVEPPAAWVSKAIALAETNPARDFIEAIRATLVREIHPRSALVGVRGDASLARRQLLYRSALGAVHLSITLREGGGALLQGQLLPTADSLRLEDGRLNWVAGDANGIATLSAHGEFGPCELPAGPIRLQWAWKGGRIVVDDLTV